MNTKSIYLIRLYFFFIVAVFCLYINFTVYNELLLKIEHVSESCLYNMYLSVSNRVVLVMRERQLNLWPNDLQGNNYLHIFCSV